MATHESWSECTTVAKGRITEHESECEGCQTEDENDVDEKGTLLSTKNKAILYHFDQFGRHASQAVLIQRNVMVVMVISAGD